jgi:putative transcriptional regulator
MKSRLRLLRAEHDLTQEELATRIGVSRQAINALETERHDPSLDLAYKVAAAFGVPVEQVFPNPHEPNPHEPNSHWQRTTS